jgi:hypothetical protein
MGAPCSHQRTWAENDAFECFYLSSDCSLGHNISGVERKVFEGASPHRFRPTYAGAKTGHPSAARETASFLCDENVSRKLESGTQFAHLLQGELALGGQEHRNRTLRSELWNQIPLCKALLFNQESYD